MVVYNFALYLLCAIIYFFFFKQKTAYEMRISDWSSDVCSSDLPSLLIRSQMLYPVELRAHADDRGRTRPSTPVRGVGRYTKRRLKASMRRLAKNPLQCGTEDRKSTRLNSSH